MTQTGPHPLQAVRSRTHPSASRGRRLARRLTLVALVLGATAPTATAQTTAARPDRGVTRGASYSVSDIESISLTSGNVNLSIPLASLPPVAGGKLSWTLRATYNSKLWNVTRDEKEFSADTSWSPYVVDTPEVSDLGGWRIGAAYRVVIRNVRDDFNYQTPQQHQTGAEDWVALQSNYYKVILITPDGAEHELRPTDSSNYYNLGTRPYLQNHYRDTPQTTGTAMRYYSFDGSYLSALVTSEQSWTVFMPDGTQVVQTPDGVQRLRDTNGNGIKIHTDAEGVTHYRDEQTEREIKYARVSPTQGHVWYQMAGGTWARIDINFGTTRVQGKVYQVAGWTQSGGEGGGAGTCTHDAVLQKDIPVIREIVFPATEPAKPGGRFAFQYTSDATETYSTDSMRFVCGPAQSFTTTASVGMGALSRMTTPTDVIVDYTYTLSSQHRFFAPDSMTKEIVTGKAVTHDGLTDLWEYDINGGFGGSVTNPDGSVSDEVCYPTDPAFASTFGGPNGKGGLVYRSNKSGKVLVERHWKLMPFAGANAGAAGAVGQLTAFNPVVDAEYTTLLEPGAGGAPVPVKMSAKTFQHDYNGNVTEVKEFDWFDPSLVGRDAQGVPTGVPNHPGVKLLRTSLTSYHNSPGPDASSPHVYARRALVPGTPSFINAVVDTKVGGSETQFCYDGLPFGTAPTAGNVTRVSRRDDKGDGVGTNDTWVHTFTTYGPHGNPATTTDANGNVTQYFYEDAAHAQPTRVVVDPLNGTGAQTTVSAYDHATGLVLATTDANGQTTNVDYTSQLLGTADPFGRPGVSIEPPVTVNGQSHRRRVFTFYEDDERRVRVEADLNAEGDRLLKSRVTADQLGRPVLSEQSEDGSSYAVSTHTVYAQMGRITFTSNPMRAAAAATDGWTRTTNDSAGRPVEVATFAGAAQPPPSGTNVHWTGSVTTEYWANETTVTDQATKRRRSATDAAGRLVEVVEAPGEAGYGYLTAYEYDALNNLRKVTQGQAGQTQQTRVFSYDSLSRMLSASNPESGLTLFTYFPNGNTHTRTDARGVVTTYAYDGLNRLTARTYSANSQGAAWAPAVTYAYDTVASNGKGRLASVGNGVATYSFTGYDALGRVTGSAQTVNVQAGVNVTYSMPAYRYNLAGQLVSEQYPSGRVVTTERDPAGRVAGVRNAATGAFFAGAASGDAANRISYTAHGAASAVRLGNGLWEHTSYNSRLQPTEIGLGSSAADSGRLRLDYGYGPAQSNNGNVRSQRVLIPNALDLTQTYDYDPVNRLARASESPTAGGAATWRQTYTYLDAGGQHGQFGNRRLDASSDPATGQPRTTTNVMPQYNPTINPANNRYHDNQGYAYDPAGNLTTAPDHTYQYDGDNRLRSVDGGATQYAGASYFYDGDGRRVKKVLPTETTFFVYDAHGLLVAEYSNQTAAGGTSYLTQDHLGSTRVVTGADGQPKSRHDYLPFGEEVQAAVGGRDAVAAPGYNLGGARQKFTSAERDAETGLDFMQARYYASAQGRFTSVDPYDINLERQIERHQAASDDEANALLKRYICNALRWNRYAYVLNNPLKYVDPTGEQEEEIIARVNIVYDRKTIGGEAAARRLTAAAVADATKTYAAARIKLEVTYTAGTATGDGDVYSSGLKITEGKVDGAVNIFVSENRGNWTGGVSNPNTGESFINYGRSQPGNNIVSHELGHQFGVSSKKSSLGVVGDLTNNLAKDLIIDSTNSKLLRGVTTEGIPQPVSGRNSTHVPQRPLIMRQLPTIAVYRNGARRFSPR